MKSVAKFIKEARLERGLTQKQFAEKFSITEKAVSNYENGIRTPDLDFLVNLSREFNLSLDSLMETQKEESKFDDLVVVERNGKKAILDKKQDAYLTSFNYDDIRLSKCGYHIVKKKKKNIGLAIEGISFVVDNWGKKIGFKDFLVDISSGERFEDCEHCSFEMGVCPAFNIRDGKEYLIDINENKISKGYKRIMPAVEDVSYGLFSAILSDDFKERVLIDSKGEELDLEVKLTPSYLYREQLRERKFSDNIFNNVDEIVNFIEKYGLDAELIGKIPPKLYKDNEAVFEETNKKFLLKYNEEISKSEGLRMFYLPQIDTLEKALNMIDKYGFDIINFIPQKNFEMRRNYQQILFALLKYTQKIIDKNQLIAVDALVRSIQTLVRFANIWGVSGEINAEEKGELKTFAEYIENRIESPKERIRLIGVMQNAVDVIG